MSKELEALYKFSQIEFETGDYMSDDGYTMKIESTEMYDILLKALTPPTADEVCKALSKYLQTIYGKVVIYYENKNFGMEIQHSVDEITSHELVSLLNDNIIYIGENLPPHLITLIGRFYEGLEE
jgi:hypothetical protein